MGRRGRHSTPLAALSRYRGIRQHLLELLDDLVKHTAGDRYPIGHSLAEAIIWQLGQFEERRAVPRLQWISTNLRGGLADYARTISDEILADTDGPT